MYQLTRIPSFETEQTSVMRLADNTCIPFHLDNTDYQEYLKWVAEGNEPLPADE